MQMDRTVTVSALRPRSPASSGTVSARSSALPPSLSTSVVEEWMSGGVIAVLILASLCVVLGLIYGYIYFTRINPLPTASSTLSPIISPLPHHQPSLTSSTLSCTRINPRAGRGGAGRSTRRKQSLAGDDGASLGVSTHVFLFKKS